MQFPRIFQILRITVHKASIYEPLMTIHDITHQQPLSNLSKKKLIRTKKL